MREVILNYIEIRNRYLAELRKNLFEPLLPGRLRIANDAVRKFAKLEPGPTTPVLEPDEAACQLQLCDEVDHLLDLAAPYNDFAAYAQREADPATGLVAIATAWARQAIQS